MRSDKKNSSLYFSTHMQVLNRIDSTSLSDEIPDICQLDRKVVANTILPSKSDDKALRKNIATIVSRVLVEHLGYFKFAFEDVVEWHIKHQYYREMEEKTVVVPLGVILKNENKGDEMVDIMAYLHQYVPSINCSEKKVISTGETILEEKAKFHQILVGGDQLTVVRARSAIKVKVNSHTPSKKLSGIIPVVEDWHAKANFLGLIFRFYFSSKSVAEHGTLCQLRNLLGRTNVVKVPLDDFNACDEFFVLVVKSHILAATMKMLEISDVDVL